MSTLSLNEPSSELFIASNFNSPMRVLVVDDDPFTLTIIKKRLAMGGYEIDRMPLVAGLAFVECLARHNAPARHDFINRLACPVLGLRRGGPPRLERVASGASQRQVPLRFVRARRQLVARPFPGMIERRRRQPLRGIELQGFPRPARAEPAFRIIDDILVTRRLGALEPRQAVFHLERKALGGRVEQRHPLRKIAPVNRVIGSFVANHGGDVTEKAEYLIENP